MHSKVADGKTGKLLANTSVDSYILGQTFYVKHPKLNVLVTTKDLKLLDGTLPGDLHVSLQPFCLITT
jgi:hypothetical protein